MGKRGMKTRLCKREIESHERIWKERVAGVGRKENEVDNKCLRKCCSGREWRKMMDKKEMHKKVVDRIREKYNEMNKEEKWETKEKKRMEKR